MGIYLYCWYCGWLRNPAPGRVDGKRPAIIPSFPVFRSISMYFRVTNSYSTNWCRVSQPSTGKKRKILTWYSPLLVPQYLTITLFSSCRPLFSDGLTICHHPDRPKLNLDEEKNCDKSRLQKSESHHGQDQKTPAEWDHPNDIYFKCHKSWPWRKVMIVNFKYVFMARITKIGLSY